MLVVRKASGKTEERKVEQLNFGVEIEARKNDISFVPRMVAVEKLDSVKKKPGKMKEAIYSLTESLMLTQKELQ